MTGRTPEQRIVDYLRSGPEAAAAEFIETTLRPIPRMRQRRSWRIHLGRFGGPLLQPIAIGLGVVVIAGTLVVSASVGGWMRPSPDPSGPTFELTLAASDPAQVFSDAGRYATDPSATTNTCRRLDDGFWQVAYSGGDPYVRLNVLVGPEAAAGGRSEDVSAEMVIGSPLTSLLNFDQPGYRSGDAPGRSTATVDTTVGPDAITFDISATTPAAKVDFTDYPFTVDIDLHVVCPTGD